MQSLNDGLECASVAHSATTLTKGATSPLENQEALAYLNTVCVWYFAVFRGCLQNGETFHAGLAKQCATYISAIAQMFQV
ncbi:TPA: hypothetical protein AB5D93_001230, partial [Vibrio cholerae]